MCHQFKPLGVKRLNATKIMARVGEFVVMDHLGEKTNLEVIEVLSNELITVQGHDKKPCILKKCFLEIETIPDPDFEGHYLEIKKFIWKFLGTK